MNSNFLLRLLLGASLLALPLMSISQTDCDNDLIPPIALCVEEVDVELIDGSAILDLASVDNGSTDNCAIFSMSLTQETFDCAELPISYGQFLSYSKTIIPIEIYSADGYKSFTGTNGIKTVSEGFSSDKVEFYLESTAGLIPGTNCFEVKVNDFKNVISMQYAFEFDAEYLSFVDINNVSLSLFTPQNFSAQDSTVTISWNSLNPVMGESFIDGTTLFSMCFEELNNDPLITTLYISDDAGNTSACNTLVNLIGEDDPISIECVDIQVELPASGEAQIDPSLILDAVNAGCSEYELFINNDIIDCDNYFITEKHAPYFLAGSLLPEAINMDGAVDFEGISYFESLLTETTSDEKVSFELKQFSEDDSNVCFSLEVSSFIDILGFQFSLAYDPSILKVNTVSAIDLTNFFDSNYNTSLPGQINFSWNSQDAANGLSLDDESELIQLCFEKSMNTSLNNQMTLVNLQGASTSCDFAIEIIDITPPELFLEDVVISLGEDGTASLSKDDFIGLVEDNCGIASIDTDQLSFDCSDIVTYPDVDINILNLPVAVEFINIDSDLLSVVDILSGELIAEGTSDESVGINIIQNVGEEPYQICYDFVVEDFNEMIGMQFSVSFDELGLNYTGLESSDLPFFSNQNINLSSSGELIISWLSLDIENGVSVPAGFNMFSVCFDYLGSIGQEVELTAVDYSGNAYTGIAYAVVVDDTAPTMNCDSTAVIYLNQDGLALLLEDDYTVEVEDNCSMVNVSVGQNNFTCEDLGVNAVTFTSSDDYNNESSCVIDIEVVSNIAPSLTCKGVLVDVFSDGTFELSQDDMLVEATDDCEGVTFSLNQSIWDCQTVSNNEINIISGVNEEIIVEFADVESQPLQTDFTLDCETSSFGSGAKTVSLEILPSSVSSDESIICYDFNVFDFENMLTMQFSMAFDSSIANFIGAEFPILDANHSDLTVFSDEKNVSLLWAGNDFVNGLSVEDGVSIVTMCFETSIDFSERVAELTATDASGNSSSCEVLISVCDKVNPIAECKDISVSLDADNQLLLMGDLIDNGSSDDCCLSNLSVLRVDTACDEVTDFAPTVLLCEEDLGEEILVLLRAEDCSGNSSICESLVEVDDATSLNNLPNTVDDFNVYPNPFNEQFNLSFNLAKGAFLRLEIVDSNGKLIVLRENYYTSGKNDLQFEGIQHSGVYILRIQGEHILLHQKITRI